MQDTLAIIFAILHDDYGISIELTADTLLSDVGIDSVDTIGFLFSLEEKTGVKIPDAELNSDKLRTLGQFARYVYDNRA